MKYAWQLIKFAFCPENCRDLMEKCDLIVCRPSADESLSSEAISIFPSSCKSAKHKLTGAQWVLQTKPAFYWRSSLPILARTYVRNRDLKECISLLRSNWYLPNDVKLIEDNLPFEYFVAKRLNSILSLDIILSFALQWPVSDRNA